jgi:ribonuclease P protein component
MNILRKTLTLKKNIEFKHIFNRGKWYNGNVLSIYIMHNKKNINLLGIAVSKKTAKSVKRNRIKRLIREVYRLYEGYTNTGYSIILVWKIKKDIAEATFENIKTDMINCFTKAGVLNNNEKNMYFSDQNISENTVGGIGDEMQV